MSLESFLQPVEGEAWLEVIGCDEGVERMSA